MPCAYVNLLLTLRPQVCPTGAVTSDGRAVTFRGNVGPTGTGTNGNAQSLNGAGLPIDPAAETFKKQASELQNI